MMIEGDTKLERVMKRWVQLDPWHKSNLPAIILARFYFYWIWRGGVLMRLLTGGRTCRKCGSPLKLGQRYFCSKACCGYEVIGDL
jgi:hypothetical protein